MAMTDTPFTPAPAVFAEIEGSPARFPVRRIYCVGRNYAAHRREMGGDDREPPFFFSKPADAVVASGSTIPYAAATSNLHHEVELVVALKGGGVDVPVDSALELVFGYAAGVDLTRRDLQTASRNKGQPWDSAKGFDQSAPLGPIRPWSGAAPQGRISLTVNGAVRQDASLADMIWNVAEIISECSRLWRLAPGDLIYTGTPEGVGPLISGDQVEVSIEDVGALNITIA